MFKHSENWQILIISWKKCDVILAIEVDNNPKHCSIYTQTTNEDKKEILNAKYSQRENNDGILNYIKKCSF